MKRIAGLRNIRNYRVGELRNRSPEDPFGFLSEVSDFNAIARALRHCGRARATGDGRSLHSLLIKHGLCGNAFLSNNLIAMYADFRSFDDAQRVFGEMPERNVVSWTTSISAYTGAGNPAEALRSFTRMMDSESEEAPNGYTFSAVLKACGVAGDLELGRWIHEQVLVARLESDTVLMNAIIDMYVKCGSLGEARKVFDGILAANSTSWNTMIAGYTKEGEMDKAEDMLAQIPEPDAVSFNTIIAGFAQRESLRALEYVCLMHRHGHKLDQFTFPCALKTCGSLRLEEMGRQIHCYVIKSGFESSCFSGSSLIDMYANCGGVDEAMKIYDKFSNCRGTASDVLGLSNAMVSGFAANGCNRFALGLVAEVHCSGIALDAYTLSGALKACINLHNLRLGLQVHALVVTSGYLLDYVVGSVLVELYVKCVNLENALMLFHGLLHKDVVTWAGLVAGCVQQGSNYLAFSLFRDMISSNVEVDQFVLSSVLKACATLAGLEGGKQVHAHSIKNGFEMESVMVTSLIDMYSKCGEIEDGLTVFRTVVDRDTVCWTGIIVGCGYNGRAKEAIEFFRDMLKLGVVPNKITFLGVLSACRNAGWFEEACTFFKAMGEEHSVMPCLEHYCCMVDILSRAGCIEEARMLIADMPYEPNETIWNSLFGGCGIHNNADICGPAKEHLLPVLPQDTSLCVTLSNYYAGLGMWDGSTKLREVIRSVGMKNAGLSWIEVKS